MKKPLDKRIAVGTVCGRRMPIPDIGIPLRLGTLPWDKCMACEQAGCRSLLCEEGAGQQEDIDALPWREYFIVFCSLMACGNSPSALHDLLSVAVDLDLTEGAMAVSEVTRGLGADWWGEAMSLVCNGEGAL